MCPCVHLPIHRSDRHHREDRRTVTPLPDYRDFYAINTALRTRLDDTGNAERLVGCYAWVVGEILVYIDTVQEECEKRIGLTRRQERVLEKLRAS